jgi:hypothetical protein
MIRLLKIISICLLVPLLLVSCNRDRDLYINNDYATYGIIDATINGYTWGASQGYASQQNFSLQLYGSAPDGSALTITIYPYNGLGSYGANSPAEIHFLDADGYEYYANTGTVTITSDYIDQVQGNFSFSAVGNGSSGYIDMSGTFNLNY